MSSIYHCDFESWHQSSLTSVILWNIILAVIVFLWFMFTANQDEIELYNNIKTELENMKTIIEENIKHINESMDNLKELSESPRTEAIVKALDSLLKEREEQSSTNVSELQTYVDNRVPHRLQLETMYGHPVTEEEITKKLSPAKEKLDKYIADVEMYSSLRRGILSE